MTPPELASASKSPTYPTQINRTPIPSCSKGPRGLSVLPRVTSIFTRTAISPSLWLRQLRSRYAIRAGRNLPDKEFRYLRTVIVTAAVYWGLSSELRSEANRPLNLPAPGRRQPVYVVLRLCTDLCFCKQSLPLVSAAHSAQGASPSPARPPSPEVTGAFCRVP